MAKKKAKKAQATPAQLRKRVDAMTKEAERLAARLADCDRHVYEGEGHGWRRAATVADELARIDAFLTRHALA